VGTRGVGITRGWYVGYPLSNGLTGHTPVLPAEVAELLDVRSGEVVLDATVGLGGHASFFCQQLGPAGLLIGIDRDQSNLAVAGKHLEGLACQVKLIHANFADAGQVVKDLGHKEVDVLFADLGLSSTQLDQAERGFSFSTDGPLDMRMDPCEETATAADLVNRLREKELSDLIYLHSQERASRRIAKRICEARRDKRIVTTGRLAEVVAKAMGTDQWSRKAKIHPATRTFLALRMAVNDEMGSLDQLLADGPGLVRTGGRLGFISFCSTEDRRVKRAFLAHKREGVLEIITKKPVVAQQAERRNNPRSRSAKLRVAKRN